MVSTALNSKTAPTIDELRSRIRGLEEDRLGASLPTHPALAGLVRLRAGAAYEVGSLGLAIALMAGPSAAGAWSAVVGIGDLGLEAAAEAGVTLERMVLVPEPGEQWAEVVASLVEVSTVVVLRPPGRVGEGVASRLAARLRKQSAVLVAWGPWPRPEARLSVASSAWSGLGRGHGRLRSRDAVVAVRRGGGPVRQGAWAS